jgi:N-methylhydantoinase A
MRDESVVSIEIGGTSCDVTVMESGNVAERTSFRIGGDVIALPAVDIHTIALGGGTIAGVDEAGLLFVGPHGAGARPGPAAFGLGGREPTVTDAHVVLGRLRSGRYGGGALKLDERLAAEAIERQIAKPLHLTTEEAAIAIIRMGELQIRHAVEQVTLERGHDPARITLLAGGGAGPLHAAAVARQVGCRHVFVPRLAGVFCAFGMCSAQARHDWVQEVGLLLEAPTIRAVRDVAESLRARAEARFGEDGFDPSAVELAVSLDLRYSGQRAPLNVRFPASLEESSVRTEFEARHRREFGFAQPGGRIEVVAVRLTGSASLGRTVLSSRAPSASVAAPIAQRRVWVGPRAGWQDIPIFDAQQLPAKASISGPALVEDSGATTLIADGDRLLVDDRGNFHIEVSHE